MPHAPRSVAWPPPRVASFGALAFVILTAALLAVPPVRSFTGHLLKLYQPREFCMLYEPGVIWLHVAADTLIALAYYSIPIALIYFVRRRTDLTFSWMYVCFAVFILACGTTHVMNIIAIWYAAYRLDGVVKLFTAAFSIATAIALWPLIPKALALPSPDALRRANGDLAREVEVRRAAEDSLRSMHAELERRVEERTVELRLANEKLTAEAAARGTVEQERERLLERERQARADAELANRSKDDFLATLSHELRTPLSAITGWVYVLQGTTSRTELQNGLAIIERNARAQSQLIDDLLDMSRIISGKLRLERHSVNFVQTIESAVETVRLTATTKDIRLAMALPTDSLLVTGDSGRLQQIVWNLLLNAVKFTPAGGEIRVSLTSSATHLELAISDNGAGIAPEFLPSLFERFRQADSSLTRQHGGLGIGLALVRHLAEAHGGSVRAESAGEGCGSTFFVRLPLRVEMPLGTETLGDRNLGATHGGDLAGVSVLVVDDEADTREMLERLLVRHRATVRTTASAHDALALLQAMRPTVLVSDIAMPDEDGYTLIAAIRRLPPECGGTTPAIALTALARKEDRLRAMLAGFQMHLAKPIEPSELVVVIKSLVARPQNERSQLTV